MSSTMTYKQRILKLFYPVLMMAGKWFGRRSGQISSTIPVRAPMSFYSLDMQTNQGKTISFSEFKGKKILIVNTASACGYTAQYAELQMLADQFNKDLVILGFPSNDFGEQEQGTDEEIASFCSLNYGISFPLAKKTRVVKDGNQNKVFRWLTHKEQNGWNDREPGWNFSKYLVNEKGLLAHCFEPGISPVDPVVVQSIEE
jgi:glutathione peroxidase